MTIKKKTTPPKKATSLTEPAVATKSVKPSKKAMEKATAKAAAATAAPAAVQAPVAVATTPALVAAPAPTVTVTIAPEVPAAKPVLTIGMLQKRLYEQGCYGGHWDGHYGPMTKHGVARFQQQAGLPTDGEPTPETLAALGF